MLNGKKWRRFISAKLLIASMILGGAAMKASGAWGDLDTSFGSGGTYQETATGYQLGDVVMQPDGKILVTGSKLNSNGKKRFFLRRYYQTGDSTRRRTTVLRSKFTVEPNYDTRHRGRLRTAAKLSAWS